MNSQPFRDLLILKLWTQSDIIKQHGNNQLRVVTTASLTKYYINGTLVAQITDPDYKTGSVGLYVNEEQEIAFDNMLITETTMMQPLLLKKPVVVDRTSGE